MSQFKDNTRRKLADLEIRYERLINRVDFLERTFFVDDYFSNFRNQFIAPLKILKSEAKSFVVKRDVLVGYALTPTTKYTTKENYELFSSLIREMEAESKEEGSRPVSSLTPTDSTLTFSYSVYPSTSSSTCPCSDKKKNKKAISKKKLLGRPRGRKYKKQTERIFS